MQRYSPCPRESQVHSHRWTSQRHLSVGVGPDRITLRRFSLCVWHDFLFVQIRARIIFALFLVLLALILGAPVVCAFLTLQVHELEAAQFGRPEASQKAPSSSRPL